MSNNYEPVANGPDKVLTKKNHVRWKKHMSNHFSDKKYMSEMIDSGKEPIFAMEKLETRVPAILQGSFKTKTENIVDGFQIDEDGFFRRRKDQEQELKEMSERNKKVEKEKEDYASHKLLAIKYTGTWIDKEIADELDIMGDEYLILRKNADIVKIMEVLCMISTGRGAQTVAHDCARFLKVSIGGNTVDDYTKFQMEFRDRYKKLTEGRKAEDVLKVICDSKFVMCLVGYAPLKVQLDLLMSKEVYPSWMELATEYRLFLTSKRNMEEAMRSDETFNGSVQANAAGVYRGPSKSRKGGELEAVKDG